jgi:hypothetical protein
MRSGGENSLGIPPKILSSGRYYFLPGATAAAVSWLQWVWIVIRRSAISGFRYKIFPGIPDEFKEVSVFD